MQGMIGGRRPTNDHDRSRPGPRPRRRPGPPRGRPAEGRWGAAPHRGGPASHAPIRKPEAWRRRAPRPAEPEPPATVPELLARIRESPAHVAAAAELLSRDLDDRKSWSGFHAA